MFLKMTRCSLKFEITAFWTDVRIASAIPEVKKSYEGFLLTMQRVQDVTKVPDKDRTSVPYKSIGKLVYVKGGKPYSASAFAANVNGAKNVIFTAAHSLRGKNGDATKICLIPALKDDGEQPYKVFEQIEGGEGKAWFVPSKQDSKAKPVAYDIGAVKLKQNADGNDIGDLVPLIDIEVNKKLAFDTACQIIGYGYGNTMYKITGTEICGKIVSLDGPGFKGISGSPLLLSDGGSNKATNLAVAPYYTKELVTHGFKGMSGSPWLLSDTESIGTHAGSNKAANVAVAPYYTKELIDDLLKQLKFSEHKRSYFSILHKGIDWLLTRAAKIL